VLIAVVLGGAVLGGSACTDGTGMGAGDGSVPDLPTMADNLSYATWSALDAFEALASAGLPATTGTGDFAPCEGTSGEFAPVVTGTMRAEDDRLPTLADVERWRDTVLPSGIGGWIAEDSKPFVDGIAETGDGWEIGLRHKIWDVDMRVTVAADSPDVTIVATGLCLPTTAEEQAFYDAMGTWTLNNVAPRPPESTIPSSSVDAPPSTG
jgi:hypothetical protein